MLKGVSSILFDPTRGFISVLYLETSIASIEVIFSYLNLRGDTSAGFLYPNFSLSYLLFVRILGFYLLFSASFSIFFKFDNGVERIFI